MCADGVSHTYAMGEVAGGSQWPLCRGVGCTDPLANNTLGRLFPANHGWQIGQPSDYDQDVFGAAVPFACTMERLNKNPVTENYMGDGAGDRRISQRDCRSSRQKIAAGETPDNSTCNFRSQHEGGGHFLMGDGSVQFVSENIDFGVYQGASTSAGNEVQF